MGGSGRNGDRRRDLRATLVGSALVGPKGQAGRVVSAVLDNASRIGAGFHAREQLDVHEAVTVSIELFSGIFPNASVAGGTIVRRHCNV